MPGVLKQFLQGLASGNSDFGRGIQQGVANSFQQRREAERREQQVKDRDLLADERQRDRNVQAARYAQGRMDKQAAANSKSSAQAMKEYLGLLALVGDAEKMAQMPPVEKANAERMMANLAARILASGGTLPGTSVAPPPPGGVRMGHPGGPLMKPPAPPPAPLRPPAPRPAHLKSVSAPGGIANEMLKEVQGAQAKNPMYGPAPARVPLDARTPSEKARTQALVDFARREGAKAEALGELPEGDATPYDDVASNFIDPDNRVGINLPEVFARQRRRDAAKLPEGDATPYDDVPSNFIDPNDKVGINLPAVFARQRRRDADKLPEGDATPSDIESSNFIPPRDRVGPDLPEGDYVPSPERVVLPPGKIDLRSYKDSAFPPGFQPMVKTPLSPPPAENFRPRTNQGLVDQVLSNTKIQSGDEIMDELDDLRNMRNPIGKPTRPARGIVLGDEAANVFEEPTDEMKKLIAIGRRVPPPRREAAKILGKPTTTKAGLRGMKRTDPELGRFKWLKGAENRLTPRMAKRIFATTGKDRPELKKVLSKIFNEEVQGFTMVQPEDRKSFVPNPGEIFFPATGLVLHVKRDYRSAKKEYDREVE